MSSLPIKQKPNKIALIGDANVGKTCLIQRLKYKSFGNTKSTIGACNENITINGINLDIWDTAGQERFRSMVPLYFKGAKAILICFDITDVNSFDGAKKWLSEIENLAKKTIIFLVGNKCDLEDKRKISFENGNLFSKDKGIFYYETSAKNDVNVTLLFEKVAEEISKIKVSEDNGKININYNNGESNDSGCGCL